jgi:hypothetical protein
MTHPHTLGVVKFFEKSVFIADIEIKKAPFIFWPNFRAPMERWWSGTNLNSG